MKGKIIGVIIALMLVATIAYAGADMWLYARTRPPKDLNAGDAFKIEVRVCNEGDSWGYIALEGGLYSNKFKGTVWSLVPLTIMQGFSKCAPCEEFVEAYQLKLDPGECDNMNLWIGAPGPNTRVGRQYEEGVCTGELNWESKCDNKKDYSPSTYVLHLYTGCYAGQVYYSSRGREEVIWNDINIYSGRSCNGNGPSPGDDPKIIYNRDVRVTSDGRKVTTTFSFTNNGGTMTENWLVEIQHQPEGSGLMAIGGGETCDPNHPENIHQFYRLGAGETEDFTFTYVVDEEGEYDIWGATRKDCYPAAATDPFSPDLGGKKLKTITVEDKDPPPVTGCTHPIGEEGEKLTRTCDDKTEIVVAQCYHGKWIETTNECEGGEEDICSYDADCKKKVIDDAFQTCEYERICLNNKCIIDPDTPPSCTLKSAFYYAIGGALLVIVVFAMIAVMRRK